MAEKVLKEFTSSIEFRTGLRKLNFDPDAFSFEILSKKYRDEAIDIMCYQFSKMGGNYGSVIFNISMMDMYPKLAHMIDHAINTRLSYIVLDKNNRIAWVGILFDATNIPSKLNPDLLPLNVQKRDELCNDRDKTLPFIKYLPHNIAYGLIKPGECLYSCRHVVRPDLQNQGYSIQFGSIQFALQIGLGYKYNFAAQSHPASVHRVGNKIPLMINAMMKRKVCFISKFDIHQYVEKKFETDSWYKQNLDKAFVLKYCKGNFFTCRMFRFDIIAEKYDMKQFWTLLIAASSRSKL